jgi:hypothetical protein
VPRVDFEEVCAVGRTADHDLATRTSHVAGTAGAALYSQGWLRGCYGPSPQADGASETVDAGEDALLPILRNVEDVSGCTRHLLGVVQATRSESAQAHHRRRQTLHLQHLSHEGRQKARAGNTLLDALGRTERLSSSSTRASCGAIESLQTDDVKLQSGKTRRSDERGLLSEEVNCRVMALVVEDPTLYECKAET